MTDDRELNGPQLVLVTPFEGTGKGWLDQLADILASAPFASVIIGSDTGDKMIARACEICREAEVASLVYDNSQAMGHYGANGLHLNGNVDDIKSAIDQYQKRYLIGIEVEDLSRHHALQLGENQPDYLFFGSLAGADDVQDRQAILALASWWADVTTVPGIAFLGSDSDIQTAREARLDFIALRDWIWQHQQGPVEAARLAFNLLKPAR